VTTELGKRKLLVNSSLMINRAPFTVCAHAADSFEERVAIAKKLQESDVGKAYEKVLIKAIGSYVATSMQQCFPAGVRADTDRFVLVADLLANQSLGRIEVRPDTKMTRCFAEKLAGAPFPRPPDHAEKDCIQIFFDIKITP
jgi:hypothetical protein